MNLKKENISSFQRIVILVALTVKMILLPLLKKGILIMVLNGFRH